MTSCSSHDESMCTWTCRVEGAGYKVQRCKARFGQANGDAENCIGPCTGHVVFGAVTSKVVRFLHCAMDRPATLEKAARNGTMRIGASTSILLYICRWIATNLPTCWMSTCFSSPLRSPFPLAENLTRLGWVGVSTARHDVSAIRGSASVSSGATVFSDSSRTLAQGA